MKRLFSIFLLLVSLSCWAFAQNELVAHNNKYNKVSYRALSELSVNGLQGVSAAFAGRCGNTLIVAGGCNFPDVPAADGGDKVYYDHIFACTSPLSDTGDWKEIGRLPRPLAYGACVTVRDGMVLMGGYDSNKCRSEVYLLKYKEGQLSIHPLPSLPVPLSEMSAAYGDGYIYVAGGQSNHEASFGAYRMSYPGGKEWESLPEMPGAARLQCVGAMQNGAEGPCFYVMGGYSPSTGKTTGLVNTDGIYYNPLTKKWHSVAPIAPYGKAMALIGASAVPSGCAHIVFMGGVNYEIFEKAINRSATRLRAESKGNTSLMALIDQEAAQYMHYPQEWYKFNKELLIYHTLTDTWTTESSSPLLARAGLSVVPYKDNWIVIDGESKPGIRSANVTAVNMKSVTQFGWPNWVVLALYLMLMIGLGFYFMRRDSDSEIFFKGHGNIPWWAAGISIYATMLSAITYMAYPAKAFATDWTYYPMMFTILLASFPVIRYYLPFFRKLKVASAYEYLELRFNAPTRLMASALFIIFMVARMALVLYLPSLALTAVTGINIYFCILLMGLITIIYCTMGGVEAVIWGDVVQATIIMVGAFLAFGYLVLHTDGGVSGFFDIAMNDDKFRLFDWSFDYRSATFWVIIIGGFANNLISLTSDQTIIQRYLTTKDEKAAQHGILLNGVMSICVSVVFFAIGTALYTFFKTHPAELNFTMEQSDTIFPFFMMSQLPQGLAGLLIAAIFAATMSTISSSINSVSTAFSVDFYKHWRPSAVDANTLKVARSSSFFFGIIGLLLALFMATWEILSMLDFFQEILGLLTSGLGGLFLMGIFFPRIGGKSALIGFCSGVLSVFVIKYTTDTSFLLYGAIGLVVSVLVAFLFSFIMKEERPAKALTWQNLKRERRGEEML